MFETVQGFKDWMLNLIGKLTPALTKFMGLALIFNSMLLVYADYRSVGHIEFLTAVSTVATVFLATLILIDFSFNLNRTMGLYAMSLGISRIFKYGSHLGDGTGITFAYSLVMFGFAINMCVTAYTYLVNSVRGRFGMMFNSTVTLILSVCQILYISLVENKGFQYVLVNDPDSISIIVLYVILLLMLTSAPIRMNTKGEKNVRTLNQIRLTHTCSPKSRILQKDADVLVKAFDDRSEWRKVCSGPVECEYKFRIIHKVEEYTYVTVQKWKDSNEIYFTLSDHLEGSITDAYRFKIDMIYIKTDGSKAPMLVMQNNDGLFMRVNIWYAEDRI